MILVTGATGFVGRNIVKKLITENREVRILVRSQNFREIFGLLPLQAFSGDISDKKSLEVATKDVDAIIHCVGILQERPPHITHQKLVIEGTHNLVSAAQAHHVKRIIYLSGLGTHEHAGSLYHKAKWKAEECIRKSSMEHVIFRPSVIFGKEDGFLNRFVKIAKLLPFVPILGDGKYKLQPISIHNLVEALVRSLEGQQTKNKTVPVGGPQRLEMNEIMDMMLGGANLTRFKLHIPWGLAQLKARFFEKIPFMAPPFTQDQLLMLKENNVTDNIEFQKLFNLSLIPLSEGLKEYSWYASRQSLSGTASS